VEQTRRSIDDLLNEARDMLPARPSPAEALRLMRSGAMLIDIRGDDQRRRDGLIPGAHVIPRNSLEWRCDPSSRWRHAAIRDHEQHVVLICDEGFQSSLAAANLQRLGLHRATDVQGGFQAWRKAGLPVLPAGS
jgi:rhodanese-related sulfurtransferase